MRRGTITGTLLGAVVAGVAGGVLLHGAVPFPGTAASVVSSGPPASSPSASSPSSSSPTDSSPTDSSSAPPKSSASAEPSASPKSTPSPDEPSSTPTGPAPAFTRAALLADADFLARGWGKAETLSVSDGVPDPAVTLCASVGDDADGLRSAYAATYRGLQTDGAEQVVRFRTVAAAEDAFADLTDQVEACDTAPKRAARVTLGTRHEPELPPLSKALWWSTGPADDGVDAQGIVGIVRVDDRIACVTLTSETSDPADTVEIESLLTQAGRRLV